MIKVAHFIHKDSQSGGPKVVRQLLAGLPTTEFEQVLLSGGKGQISQWCTEHGIAHYPVRSENLLPAFASIGALAQTLKEVAPDIVILHGQWAGPLGALAARMAGVPHTVYIAHHPSFYHSTSLWRAIRNYIAEKIPCALCDRIVALCEKGHHNYLVRGWAPENRLTTIYNGMDPKDVPVSADVEALCVAEGISPAARHAVFVGRLDDQKRVDWLLEAWDFACALRSSTEPEWHVWIVGSGRQCALIKRLAVSSPHSATIHLIGERADSLQWIAAANIIVMSSLYEGHSLVPLEGMACGKPLVSFDTDGVGESVVHNQTGLLSRLGDTKDLGQNIARLLMSPDKANRMGSAARKHLEEQFSLDRTLSQYTVLLKEVCQ